jgi:hypothetical protein
VLHVVLSGHGARRLDLTGNAALPAQFQLKTDKSKTQALLSASSFWTLQEATAAEKAKEEAAKTAFQEQERRRQEAEAERALQIAAAAPCAAPLHADVTTWTMEHVCQLFADLGAAEGELASLRKQRVNGDLLLALSDKDLREELTLSLLTRRQYGAWMCSKQQGPPTDKIEQVQAEGVAHVITLHEHLVLVLGSKHGPKCLAFLQRYHIETRDEFEELATLSPGTWGQLVETYPALLRK